MRRHQAFALAPVHLRGGYQLNLSILDGDNLSGGYRWYTLASEVELMRKWGEWREAPWCKPPLPLPLGAVVLTAVDGGVAVLQSRDNTSHHFLSSST